jgi:hypothetical protein
VHDRRLANNIDSDKLRLERRLQRSTGKYAGPIEVRAWRKGNPEFVEEVEILFFKRELTGIL